MINQPPRSVKTLMTSVAFPAFVLGHDPTRKIMCVTYNKEVAQDQAKLFERVVRSPWYRRIFPACRPAAPNRLMDWRTDQGGYRLATSIDGSVLGRGADIIILDDPNKGQEIHSKLARDRVKSAYDNVISTRLNHPKKSSLICVMQRLHQDDLSGHMREQEEWEEVVIAATAPEDEIWDLGWGQIYHRQAGELLQESRAGHAELALQKRKMGLTMFEAQYQQRPIPPDGIAVRRSWLRYYDVEPEQFDAKFASWDTASTLSEDADWSVGTIWGLADGNIYLLHVERDRLEAPDLRHRIEAIHRDHGIDVTLIEDADLGRAIVQDLRRTSRICTPIAIKPRIEKIARMQARAVMFETGRVFLPKAAEWLPAYLEELLGFPNSRHDDQVDSTSQALDYIQRRFSDDIMGEPRERPRGDKRPQGRPRPVGARFR
jgi:predicted phage terminase large subunit-like protein